MAKYQFDKGTKRRSKPRPKPIDKPDISKPKITYNPLTVTDRVENDLQHKKRSVGRPKTGRKSYKTVRLLTSTVLKINALENALGIKTQDATVDQAVDRVINSLTNDEMRAYKLWLEMFEKKEKE